MMTGVWDRVTDADRDAARQLLDGGEIPPMVRAMGFVSSDESLRHPSWWLGFVGAMLNSYVNQRPTHRPDPDLDDQVRLAAAVLDTVVIRYQQHRSDPVVVTGRLHRVSVRQRLDEQPSVTAEMFDGQRLRQVVLPADRYQKYRAVMVERRTVVVVGHVIGDELVAEDVRAVST